MYSLVFELAGLPKMTNGGFHNNWRARMAHAKFWRNKVIQACFKKAPPEPLKKAHVTLTRYSAKEPDYDGLVSGFKHCLDGLVHAGVICDDKISVIGIPEYKWEYIGHRKGKIKIELRS
jgi:hypothetical protein